MSKHTPGPWSVWYSGRGKSVFFHVSATAPAIPGYCGETKKDIAEIMTTDGASEQYNARLIAAAPDQHEALQATQLLLERLGLESSDEYQCNAAAIAKATGERQ